MIYRLFYLVPSFFLTQDQALKLKTEQLEIEAVSQAVSNKKWASKNKITILLSSSLYFQLSGYRKVF